MEPKHKNTFYIISIVVTSITLGAAVTWLITPTKIEPFISLLTAAISLLALVGAFWYGHKNKLSMAGLNVTEIESENDIIFEHSARPSFHEELIQLIKSSNNVELIGMGLNFLQDYSTNEVMSHFARNPNKSLKIFIANPHSLDVERRLIEEELSNPQPGLGKKGIIKKIDSLLLKWKGLNCPGSIKIRLFNNYLTFSLYVFDDVYFFYPYAFSKIGEYSPVFKFSKKQAKHKEVIDFLDIQRSNIENASINALDIVSIKETKHSHSELLPLAIFYIPSNDSHFFDFGSKILGYDVRGKKSLKSYFEELEIGNAKAYGFHMTICDVLFFQNYRQLNEVEKELEYLLKDFSPFTLENLEIVENFPNDKTISITCKEPSGELYALHHELVSRIYRKSSGSNYSFGRALLDRPGIPVEKAQFYMKKYKAPYVLDAFTPHFTLMNNIKNNKHKVYLEKIRTLYQESIKEEKVIVDKLAIMKYDPNNSFWYIHKEIKIGGFNNHV